MDHVTRHEIGEQPSAIEAVLERLRDREDEIAEALSGTSSVCLTGCGTSYYLADVGSRLLGDVLSSVAVPAGEVLVSPTELPEESLDAVVAVSRSGETTETVRAVEELGERYPDATVIAITCHEDSALYDAADVPILSPEGAEDSVVMTKSFSSMIVAFEYLARLSDGETGIADDLAGLPSASQQSLDRADAVARELGSETDFEKFVFLGTGEFFGLASEAMLKFEEMTLSWSKAYHPLEFRHGPKSIADEDTLVTVFLPDRALDLHADLLSDVGDLGATTIAVGTEESLDEIDASERVVVPDADADSLALYAPFFQLLGYYRAVELGLNPDEPQNLTQVVRL